MACPRANDFPFTYSPVPAGRESPGVIGPDLKYASRRRLSIRRPTRELLRFLAERLGVRRRNVRLIAGATSRRKVIEVDGLSAEQIATLLDQSEKP